MKPGGGSYQTATQVKVFSPEIIMLIEVDLVAKREDNIFITAKQGNENSIGVRVRSMITNGFIRNLGEPVYPAQGSQSELNAEKEKSKLDG